MCHYRGVSPPVDVQPPRLRLRRGLSLGALAQPGAATAALFPSICDLAGCAEEVGFDALFVPDHVMQNSVGGGRVEPMLEAYTLLGALAAMTTRIQLGALVTPVTFRHPALLAKAVTTLDVVSAGRAILGIGAGWDVEEHASYGLDFPAAPQRLARLEEAVELCRTMFTQATATFEGHYYSVKDAVAQPRPVRQRIPILIGGGGEKSTLGVVARQADAANLSAHDPDALRRKLAVLDSECESVGRDPHTLLRTAFLVPENVAHLEAVGSHLAELGIDGLIVVLTSADASDIAAYGAAVQALMPDV
jgi:F420-dependent oxidoreductase-like protein